MSNPAERVIAAVSTPPGKGGVALIRVSGEGAIAVVANCFVPRSGKPLDVSPSRVAVYGDIVVDGTPIDDVLCTLFRAPHSYTGEDTVEICCHGGILITRRVLEAVFASGAHPAEAGEFTRRALLSGRMSLTEAEGIGRLLEAQSDAQLRLSSPKARTRLFEAVSRLYGRLLALLGDLRARIDYPEEDLGEMSEEEILSSLSELLDGTKKLQATYRTGRAVSEGIPTVLCGSPNVGKSSLYNLLAGEELAIVTEIAGTTRDVLATDLPLGRVMLRLSDTAGLRESDDPVEQIGVARSRARMEESELILAVFDGSRPLDEGDRALIAELKDAQTVCVACINKSDLAMQIEEAELAEAFSHIVHISAKDGSGQSELAALVEELFTDGSISLGEEAVVASARQNAALTNCASLLSAAYDAYVNGIPVDLISSDLELALGELGALNGRTVSEEIIGEIFSRFCVGK